LKGHGEKSRLYLYDPSGTGRAVGIAYSTISDWLKEFPQCVKITVFIDSCNSGSAIEDLKELRNTHSKVVIVTSTDSENSSPGGQSGTGDSATEDFNDGEDEDHDNDGKEGDITDRFKEMKEQAEGEEHNPQLDSDPRHKSNCILD
jgi:hypothetical protein